MEPPSRGMLHSSFGPPSQVHLPSPPPPEQHDAEIASPPQEIAKGIVPGVEGFPVPAHDANLERVKQVLEYQFDLEVVCKKRELLLIDTHLRNAESMLKNMTEGSPAAAAHDEDGGGHAMEGVEEAEIDETHKKPVAFARRKDGQFVRLRCPAEKCSNRDHKSKIAFANHCRMAHQINYKTTDDAVSSIKEVVPESEVPADDPCRFEPIAAAPPKKRGMSHAVDKVAEDEVSRFYVTRRLIVGNTCERITEANITPANTDEHQRAPTHRWMVYVRPPDDSNTDLSFISKVRFFLHDTFEPNVVEIHKPPFHLRRRGWGEFPVRVQFHFKHHERNRPVDLVHPLKLHANTAPGFQALGAETPVELNLDRRTFDHNDHHGMHLPPATLRRVTNVADLTEKEIADVLAILTDAAHEYVLIRKPEETRMLATLEYAVADSEEQWASWNVGRQRSSEWQRARCLRAIVEDRLGISLPTKAVLVYTIAIGLSPRPPPAPLPEEPLRKSGTPKAKTARPREIVELPPKSSLEFLRETASLAGTVAVTPKLPVHTLLDDLWYCRYCGCHHVPQPNGVFDAREAACGRSHNVGRLYSYSVYNPALRLLSNPQRAMPATAGDPKKVKKPVYSVPPSSATAPTSGSAGTTPAAGASAVPKLEIAPVYTPLPSSLANIMLPESKYRTGVSVANQLKPVDMLQAAALFAPYYGPLAGEREPAVDHVLGAAGLAFLRRLLRASLLLYRRQQVTEAPEETRHKIMVPMHVYEAIIATPALFDMLTNAGLGK